MSFIDSITEKRAASKVAANRFTGLLGKVPDFVGTHPRTATGLGVGAGGALGYGAQASGIGSGAVKGIGRGLGKGFGAVSPYFGGPGPYFGGSRDSDKDESFMGTLSRWNKQKLPIINPLSNWVKENLHEGAGNWMGKNQLLTGAGGVGLLATLLYTLLGRGGGSSGYKFSSSIEKVSIWLDSKNG